MTLSISIIIRALKIIKGLRASYISNQLDDMAFVDLLNFGFFASQITALGVRGGARRFGTMGKSTHRQECVQVMTWVSPFDGFTTHSIVAKFHFSIPFDGQIPR